MHLSNLLPTTLVGFAFTLSLAAQTWTLLTPPPSTRAAASW